MPEITGHFKRAQDGTITVSAELGGASVVLTLPQSADGREAEELIDHFPDFVDKAMTEFIASKAKDDDGR